jgi:superfamily II DNA or RNA helicase
MALLLDIFKLKKAPSKFAKFRIKMSGQHIKNTEESTEEQLSLDIFKKRIQSRFNKPSAPLIQFKEDEKIINKPTKLSKKLKIPGRLKKTKKATPKLDEPFFRIRKDLIKIKDGEGKLLIDRLPEKYYESYDVNPPSWYQHNRDFFINFINSTFGKEYGEQIKNDTTKVSCDDFKDKGSFELMTHQKIVRDYINLHSPYRGLLLYHGLGAGKTCSSIAIAEGIKNTNTVVVMTPASLQMNYIQQLKKCGDPLYKDNQHWEFIKTENDDGSIDKDLENSLVSILNVSLAYVRANKGAWLVNATKPANYNKKHQRDRASINDQINNMIRHKYQFVNYNGLNQNKLTQLENQAKLTHGRNNIFDNKIVIIDEVHNLVSRIVNKIKKDKNNTTVTMKIYNYLLDANNCRIVALTGTPIVNYPNEIGILFNILRGYIKTYYFSLDTSRVGKLNLDKIIKILSNNGFVDYIAFNSKINELKITRNPYGFFNKKDKQRNYAGVKASKFGKVDDNKFRKSVIETLDKHHILVDANSAKIENNLALPDTFKGFNMRFIDPINKSLVNKLRFSRRILGLTSYFRSAQEKLLPRFNPDTDIDDTPLKMSDYQLAIYETARISERSSVTRKPKKNKKGTDVNELYSDNPGTYRVFSRLFCNFVFPEGIVRPDPANIAKAKLDVSDVDNLTTNAKQEQVDGRFDTDDAKKESNAKKAAKIEYNKQINQALRQLKDNSDKFLNMSKSKNLEIYSPKFALILKRLNSPDFRGCHLFYSDFRTIEGVGVFSLVLEAQTQQPLWSRFKIAKDYNGTWKINMTSEELNKSCYALYTGTEDAEEKEIIRNIYNSQWNKVPPTIVEQLQNEGFKDQKNFFGDVIKLLMITSSGSEGIDLKNVQFVHILDPYWHPVRAQQVIGRARRICSHNDLPEKYRRVKVYKYIMTFTDDQREHKLNNEFKHDKSKNPETPDRIITTDEYLYEISHTKLKLNTEILNTIKSTAIDCALYKDGRKENIVCYNYGSYDKSKFHSTPNLKSEPTDKLWIQNRKKLVSKLVEVSLPRGDFLVVPDNIEDPTIGVYYDKQLYRQKNTLIPIMKAIRDPDNPKRVMFIDP